MLTRLKVSGFKNLVDVDVRFGPFTCIAGVNGVGKSNLFDAIRFLSALADHSLMDAALSVRDTGGRTSDVRSLFHRVGDDYDREMSFEVEMIVPSKGIDDLGQEATATSTFLRYSLVLACRENLNNGSLGPLEIRKEQMAHITLGEAKENLHFTHSPAWRKTSVKSRRWTPCFISTEDGMRRIKLHQDGGGRGKPQTFHAPNLPRTVLSATNAAESPTALLARREMQSWRLLQLEPSSLREPDEFTAPAGIQSNGSHLPATLYRLARKEQPEWRTDDESAVYQRVSNCLCDLIDDVRGVRVDRDEKRELLTLFVTGKDRTSHAARSLSDGTLRFLALAVIAQDPESQGVLCLEEPENGIHPERIPSIIRLLRDIAVDTDEPIDDSNPLRQVIVNTHAPTIVQQVPDESLLVAVPKEFNRDGSFFRGIEFRCLTETWREKKSGMPICSKGEILSYLNPVLPSSQDQDREEMPKRPKAAAANRRVIDREDMKPSELPLQFNAS